MRREVTDVMLDAHRRAAAALRAGPGSFPVGHTLSMTDFVAVDGGEERVARYRCPRRVVFVDAVPLNQAMKPLRRQVRAWLTKVLEVSGGVNQHFAGTVVAEIIVPLLVFRCPRPVQEVVLLALRLLGE